MDVHFPKSIKACSMKGKMGQREGGISPPSKSIKEFFNEINIENKSYKNPLYYMSHNVWVPVGHVSANQCYFNTRHITPNY